MTILRDFLQLTAKAIASGLAVGAFAALVVLGLASTAQACEAAELPQERLHLASYQAMTEPRSKAPTPPSAKDGPSGVGALWAIHDAGLQVLLGLAALSAMGTVALIGGRTPR